MIEAMSCQSQSVAKQSFNYNLYIDKFSILSFNFESGK